MSILKSHSYSTFSLVSRWSSIHRVSYKGGVALESPVRNPDTGSSGNTTTFKLLFLLTLKWALNRFPFSAHFASYCISLPKDMTIDHSPQKVLQCCAPFSYLVMRLGGMRASINLANG